MNIAFYGTLRDSDVLGRIVGTELRSSFIETTWLSGWSCRQIEGAVYPLLQRDKGHSTLVDLYRGCSDALWQKLLAYEGDEYDWILVEIGEEVYRIFVPKATVPASAAEWTLGQFQKFWKTDFLNALDKEASLS